MQEKVFKDIFNFLLRQQIISFYHKDIFEKIELCNENKNNKENIQKINNEIKSIEKLKTENYQLDDQFRIISKEIKNIRSDYPNMNLDDILHELTQEYDLKPQLSICIEKFKQEIQESKNLIKEINNAPIEAPEKVSIINDLLDRIKKIKELIKKMEDGKTDIISINSCLDQYLKISNNILEYINSIIGKIIFNPNDIKKN